MGEDIEEISELLLNRGVVMQICEDEKWETSAAIRDLNEIRHIKISLLEELLTIRDGWIIWDIKTQKSSNAYSNHSIAADLSLKSAGKR